MHTLAMVFAITSGFVLMGYHLPPAIMIGTSVIIDLSLGPLTALIAHRHGQSAPLWIILGFCFGLWALGAALLIRLRPRSPREHAPPTSDAA